MSEKTVQPVELHPEDLRFLEAMARQYQLPDLGKAIRCLIRHAREKTELQPQIFDEIRCHDC